MTAVHPEGLTLEDMDFAILCETKNNRACPPNTLASWIVTLTCCGKVLFMCDLCLQMRMEANRHPNRVWKHEACGATSKRWSDIFGRIEPL